jgi:structure-specific endonuclease subunit SLX1
MSFVYLLISTNGLTYVGATKNVDKRLRQHNGELAGGAWATTSKVVKGETWSRVCYISGFPDWKSALQFEWRWKNISRKISFSKKPLERRMDALKQLLALERSTSKAIPYENWSDNPEIHFENACAENYYTALNSFHL